MVIDIAKTRFRYRKGQWRHRTIVLIAEMAAEVQKLKSYPNTYRAGPDNVDILGSEQKIREYSAQLTRYGILGEKHLADAEKLDFLPAVCHDIRMMLLVVLTFGSAVKQASGLQDLANYIPSIEVQEITNAAEAYPAWTTHTRRQFNAFMDLIKEILA